jgi:UDP-glucose 4-epimerase
VVVLVTGACGYLGSQLIRDLSNLKELEGMTIRLFDNMFRDRFVTLHNLPKETMYEMVFGDIRNSEKIEAAMKDVTHVLHLSDITNAPLSFERKELTYETNYSGALELFKLALNHDVERFIYTSTASVYGLSKGLLDETHNCKPQSPYGEFKLKAEQEMYSLSKESGFSWTALRLGTVGGPSVGMRYDTVINKFTFYAAIGHPLTVWETALNESRAYAEIRDVMRVYIFALQNEKMEREIYNVVSDNLSMNGVIESIKRFFPKVEVVVSPAPDHNQASYTLTSAKLEKLGFEFRYSIEDGIEQLARTLSGIHQFKQ